MSTSILFSNILAWNVDISHWLFNFLQIKYNFARKPRIDYINLYSDLNILGEISPEFLRPHKLNRTRIF